MDSALAAVIITGMITFTGIALGFISRLIPRRANGAEAKIATRLEYTNLTLNAVQASVTRLEGTVTKLDEKVDEHGDRLTKMETQLSESIRLHGRR